MKEIKFNYKNALKIVATIFIVSCLWGAGSALLGLSFLTAAIGGVAIGLLSSFVTSAFWDTWAVVDKEERP